MMEHVCQIQSYLIDRKEDLPYLNYAIPTERLVRDFSKEYIKVRQIFENNHRKVRFEFLEDYAPSLPSLLLSNGLTEEYRIDFMICTEADFVQPIPTDHFSISEVSLSSTTQKLKEFKMVQELSFDENRTICLDSIESEDVLKRIGTGAGFIGYMDNIPVSAAQYTRILNGITELVSVATLSNFRCKGLGSAISATATQSAFKNGASIVCLSAVDKKAARMYSNIGFRKIATMLAYNE